MTYTPGWVTVPCKTCGAKPRVSCVSRDGATLIGFIHIERVRAALRVSASDTVTATQPNEGDMP